MQVALIIIPRSTSGNYCERKALIRTEEALGHSRSGPVNTDVDLAINCVCALTHSERACQVNSSQGKSGTFRLRKPGWLGTHSKDLVLGVYYWQSICARSNGLRAKL